MSTPPSDSYTFDTCRIPAAPHVCDRPATKQAMRRGADAAGPDAAGRLPVKRLRHVLDTFDFRGAASAMRYWQHMALEFTVDGERLLTAGSLTVRNFHFSKAENGDKLDEPVFGPGEPIWAAFFITGYETRHDNSYDVESDAWVLDAKGQRMFAFESSGDEGSPFYPRLWLPAKLRMDLEQDIPPGNYTVVLHVRDGVSGSDATERYGFKIR